MKKSQNMLVWLSKIVFWLNSSAQFAEAGERHNKA
jgi:hypothetical protein